MRKNMVNHESNGYKIIVVDDEQGIVDSLSIFLKRSGYDFTGLTNPLEAIERVKSEHFDMMILDFMMDPIHGDEVVEEIRKFNKDLYILLLTGHKDLAPPLETIKRLEIQGYCEKSDKFDQLLLLIESGIKSIEQMNTIKEINEELHDKNEELEKAYSAPYVTVEAMLKEIVSIIDVPYKKAKTLVDTAEITQKKNEVMQYAEQKAGEYGDVGRKVIESPAFFNSSWANKSTSVKSIHDSIDSILNQAVMDVNSIHATGGDNTAVLMAR